MYPASFHYKRAKSLNDAEALFKQSADAKYLAGGQTLIPVMKQRLAAPADVIDLGGLSDLAFIRRQNNIVTIGAGTMHAVVANSADVKSTIPALAALAGGIGDPAVRARGTLGGSVANNDPAADYPAAVMALNAQVKTTKRTIHADAFFTGMFSTALDEGEIITEISFTVPQAAGYMKFRNLASRFALVGVFVAKFANEVRVAVTGAGPCVFRVPAMETALVKNFSPEAVANISVPQDGLNSDIHASAEYRAHLVTVMAKRAVAAARG
jgi:carbon-monoxide dehydrogenase medium subunit